MSTTPPEKRRSTSPIFKIEQRSATDQKTPEKGYGSVRRWGCGMKMSMLGADWWRCDPDRMRMGPRAKTWSREVPADAELFRLYSDYLHEEYGALDLLTELSEIFPAQRTD